MSERALKLFVEGMTAEKQVEMGLIEPKKYQVVWKEWSYQDNCDYVRRYHYDSHEDALAVQEHVVKEMHHFAIVQTEVPLEV